MGMKTARSPLNRLRRTCLALPGAWEKVSHGEPTFWVSKRMFASFADKRNHHGAGRDAVWCKATHVDSGSPGRPLPRTLLRAPVRRRERMGGHLSRQRA